MSTPANALSGPVWTDAEGNLYLSPDGGKTWSLQAIAPGNIPLATPSSPGLMSAALAPAATNALGYALYQSGPVDLTATSAFITIAPAVAGKIFVTQRIFFINTAVAGALTGNPSVEIGQTGSLANVLIPTSVASTFPSGAGGVLQANTNVSGGAALIASVPTGVTVTVAGTGTGGFTYTMNILLGGFYL